MFILGNKAVTLGGWNYSGLQNYMQWQYMRYLRPTYND